MDSSTLGTQLSPRQAHMRIEGERFAYLVRLPRVAHSHAIASSRLFPSCVSRARPPSPTGSNSQSASGITPHGIFLSVNRGLTAFETGAQPSASAPLRMSDR